MGRHAQARPLTLSPDAAPDEAGSRRDRSPDVRVVPAPSAQVVCSAMILTMHSRLGAVAVAALLAGTQLTAPTAQADELHNVTYRARVDGVSRGLTVTYNVSDTEVETANPTILPGQIFEANAVLANPQHAGMEISIRWPYTANLHCEILVDDAITAQADDYIAPRLVPQSNDPGYGVMPCGSELANAAAVNAATSAPNEPPPVEAPPPAG